MSKNNREIQVVNDFSSNNSKSHATLVMAIISIFTVLTLFIATFILLQLKFKEPLEVTLSDWLKMILPIVGGAIIAIFAFLGVDRLKNFDERQDRLAKELRNDLHIQVDNAVKLVQPRLNETYQEWEKSLKNRLSEYDQSFNRVTEQIKKYDKIIGSVETLEEVSDAIGNVEEACEFIVELFSNNSTDITERSQRTRILFVLVERVKSGDIKGDSDDYHNLASTLANNNYFEFASDVTEKGLEIFNDNIDLLSDFTYYSHKAGRINSVEIGLERLENIERNIWNWRAFTFYIDILNDKAATEENKVKVLQCVNDYKRVLPDEERAYMAEYETFKKYGDLDLAENALINAEENLAMTAQCSLALAHIYHMRGVYDKAINSATRAIQGQTEAQPSSSTRASFALRGFSKDAKIFNALLEGVSIDAYYTTIQSAISDYEMAIHLGYSYENVISRIKILQRLLPDERQKKQQNESIDERVAKLEFALALLAKNN